MTFNVKFKHIWEQISSLRVHRKKPKANLKVNVPQFFAKIGQKCPPWGSLGVGAIKRLMYLPLMV